MELGCYRDTTTILPGTSITLDIGANLLAHD